MSHANPARLATLIGQVSTLTTGGDLKEAAEVFRQATALDTRNARGKEAGDCLRNAKDSTGSFISLCKIFVLNGSEEIGKQALQATRMGQLSQDDVATAMHMLLESTDVGTLQDQILAALIGLQNGQTYLIILLQHDADETFERLWKVGARSIGGLITTVMNQKVWCSENVRSNIEMEIFSRLLKRLPASGKNNSETALRAIARLLAVDAANLQRAVSTESLELILSSLDVQNSIEIRSQATLATAKFLEASGERGELLLKDFVMNRVSTQRTEDLILAFSAASAMFPVIPTAAASLFLTERFVENLVNLLLRSSSGRLRQAVLELLSAACIEKTCREAIGKKCASVLEDTIGKSSNDGDSALAALVLSKLGESTSFRQGGQDELVSRLKLLILKPGEIVRQNSIDSLAYRSIQPKAKEELANDEKFLTSLVNLLADSGSGFLLFGGLTILSNLTIYPPQLSPEQKKMIT